MSFERMKSLNAQMFHRQSRLFSRLVDGTPGLSLADPDRQRSSPKKVLAFVEALLLCPTEESARARIAQDIESAELCRIHANDMDTAFDIESALSSVERATHEAPFYLLASVLLRRARLSVEKRGEDWKPKP